MRLKELGAQLRTRGALAGAAVAIAAGTTSGIVAAVHDTPDPGRAGGQRPVATAQRTPGTAALKSSIKSPNATAKPSTPPAQHGAHRLAGPTCDAKPKVVRGSVVYGSDLSMWNGDAQFRAELGDHAKRFIGMKATEGHTYTDPTFMHRARLAMRALHHGEKDALIFYHYLSPSGGSASQAHAFLRALAKAHVIKPQAHGKYEVPPGVMLAADYEGDALGHDALARGFINELSHRTGLRIQPGGRILMYGSVGNLGAFHGLDSKAPIWSAQYGKPRDMRFVDRRNGSIWQFTDGKINAPRGAARNLDLDLFSNGRPGFAAQDKLRAMAGDAPVCQAPAPKARLAAADLPGPLRIRLQQHRG